MIFCLKLQDRLYSDKIQWPSVLPIGGHELHTVKISVRSDASQIKELASLLADDCVYYVTLPFLITKISVL